MAQGGVCRVVLQPVHVQSTSLTQLITLAVDGQQPLHVLRLPSRPPRPFHAATPWGQGDVHHDGSDVHAADPGCCWGVVQVCVGALPAWLE